MEALDAVVEYVQSNNPSLREARTRVEIPTAALIMGLYFAARKCYFFLTFTLCFNTSYI